MAWAGFQDAAQAFALRLQRTKDLTPDRDRAEVKARLHEILAEVRADATVEEHADAAELLVAWHTPRTQRPVAVHLRGPGSGEWVTEWAFGGAPTAVDMAGFGLGALRYIDPADLTLEQAKILALKVVRDTIETAVESVGGEVQLGTIAAGSIEIVERGAMRGLHDTLDLWEEQMAELLPGAAEVPADSTTPDPGLGPPV
jgi:hypothetical protein